MAHSGSEFGIDSQLRRKLNNVRAFTSEQDLIHFSGTDGKSVLELKEIAFPQACKLTSCLEGHPVPIPPLNFLLDASDRSLQDAELAERGRASNLSKRLRVELDAWVESEASAMTIRWMIENREALLKGRSVTIQPHKVEFFDDIKKRA